MSRSRVRTKERRHRHDGDAPPRRDARRDERTSAIIGLGKRTQAIGGSVAAAPKSREVVEAVPGRTTRAIEEVAPAAARHAKVKVAIGALRKSIEAAPA
jgi:hypothetical protein